jgi:hypothetical protein
LQLIHEPVFGDPKTLVLVPLFLVVSFDAIGRNNLDDKVGRADDIPALHLVKARLPDKSDVRLRTIPVVQAKSHAQDINLSQVFRFHEHVDQDSQL